MPKMGMWMGRVHGIMGMRIATFSCVPKFPSVDSMRIKLLLNSNMWHFVVCRTQYDNDSTRFWVEILKLRQLSFCILNVLHFDYSKITVNMRFWGYKAVELVFAFWAFIIVWLFSDKCRSLVRREWEWVGMGYISVTGREWELNLMHRGNVIGNGNELMRMGENGNIASHSLTSVQVTWQDRIGPEIFYEKNTRSQKLSYSERLNILGLETLNRRRVIFDLFLCYKYVHGLVEINNCNFVRIHQSSRTRGNGILPRCKWPLGPFKR